MKNKLLHFGLVITLALALMLAFSLISSATQAIYVSDDLEELTTMGANPSYYTDVYNGYDNSGNVPNGNYIYYSTISHYYDYGVDIVVSVVSDIEAFQSRYGNMTFQQFEDYWYAIYDLGDYENPLYSLSSYFVYDMTETEFNYYVSYEPPQSGADWGAIKNTVDTFFNDNDVPIIEPYPALIDESSLLGYLNDNAGAYITTQTETIVAQRETLSSQSETIDILQSEIDTFEEQKTAIFDKGYNEGMEESGALKSGILALISAPVYIFGNLLDFNVFGINLFSLFTSIITIIVIAFVIKKLSN